MISKTGIHVDTASNFTNPLVYEENGQVNHVVADNLTPSTRYYTRGYVISDGTTVYSGNIKSFVTESIDYLTFSNPNNTSINLTLTKNGSPAAISGETSIDGGQTWTAFGFSGVTSQTWSIPAGEKIKFRGTNSTISSSYYDYYQFSSASIIEVSGKISTLLYYATSPSIFQSNCFNRLFENMTGLDNAGLIIDFSYINQEFFGSTFKGCTSLTTSPDFSSVTEIYSGGLDHCFDGCTSLTTPPDLSNVTFFDNNAMSSCFYNCTSLATPPDFGSMSNFGTGAFDSCFYNCTSLTTPPDFSNFTSISDFGLSNCFHGCTSLTTLPDFSNITSIGDYGLQQAFYNVPFTTSPDFSNVTSIGDYGLYFCFFDCASLETGPDFSNITSSGEYGLSHCFDGCSAIYEVTAPNISDLTADNILDNWLYAAGYNVPVGTTKVVNIPTGANIIADSESGIPIGWDKNEY